MAKHLRWSVLAVAILTLVQILGWGETVEGEEPVYYIYVAPVVRHSPEHGVFTTFALTNTSRWWFNPSVQLVDQDGQPLPATVPLMKGFGTWQKTTHAMLDEDFQGSVWVVSPQPLIGVCMLHQLTKDGTLVLVGTSRLELVQTSSSASIQGLLGGPAE